jgi:5,5'-dehydrodivanillate O-demethylase
VPIDDTHTMQILYRTSPRKPGAAPRPIAVTHRELLDAKGKLLANTIPAQDAVAWVGQGPISDRTREHLATSDRGIVIYHKLLNEQMDRVARGQEPMAVIRDRAVNEPMIKIEREGKTLGAFDSRYGSSFDSLQKGAPVPAK